MFSNTAYEAVYQYLGLQLHSKFIDVITSQKVFAGVILLTFGYLFFVTSAHFFSRYMPGVLVRRRSVPLSKFVHIIVCLFLGMSILKVGTTTSVKRFNGESWDQNPYVLSQTSGVTSEYRVSFVFDILSRTAEEFSRFLSVVVDGLFKSTNSQLHAPNLFYKAIMYAGSATIEDPALQRTIEYYTEECFDKILPLVEKDGSMSFLDRFFSSNSGADQALSEILLETPDNRKYTCLDVKKEVELGLKEYAKTHTSKTEQAVHTQVVVDGMSYEIWNNITISNLLVNHYLDKHEGLMGVQKASQLPTTSGRIFQYVNRLFSFDGLLSLIGGKEYHGASVAVSRAEEFNENLARAPHVAGFIKMAAIMIFPWLIFVVVAGYWKALVYWFLIYGSVLLWTPIWTLLYHIVTKISLSADVMEAFGKFSDGISLYSAELVTARIYQLFAVYSWLQLLIGAAFTGGILYILKPILQDSEGDSTPDAKGSAVEFKDNASAVASVGTKVLGAL